MATYTKFDIPGYPAIDIFSMPLDGFEMREFSSTKVTFVTPLGFDIRITGKNIDVNVTRLPDGTFQFEGKGTVETIARTSVGGGVTYDLLTDLGGLPFSAPPGADLASLKAIVFAGIDTFIGDAKNNSYDGGGGVDTFVIAALKADVTIKTSGNQTTLISSQGTDTLVNFEKLKFSDGSTMDLSAAVLPTANFETSYLPAAVISQIVAGANPAQPILEIRADAAQAAYDYYANVLKVAQPGLGPYESLGVSFSALETFRSKFGSAAGTDAQFIASTYKAMFLRDATVGQQKHFADQIGYFTGLYQGAGIDAATAGIQARGAVFGQMVGYVMTTDSERSTPGQLLDDNAVQFLSSIGIVGQASASSALF